LKGLADAASPVAPAGRRTAGHLPELQAAPVEETAPVDWDTVDWDREFGVVRKERDPVTGEIPLDPYPQSDANAGAAAVQRRNHGARSAVRQD